MDGVDGVLMRLSQAEAGALQVLGHRHLALPPALREQLYALNTSGEDELHRLALAGNALARCYADGVCLLLQDARLSPAEVRVVGAHGQTVRHRPGEFDGLGYTAQVLNGAALAECCGIDVVCDFRSRDVAAGGQGAPLVPAFHAALWARPGVDLAVLNLGGIANLSLLGAQGQVGGFDCGPANVLMDLWCQRHLGQDYDADGQWAAKGQAHAGLLAGLLSEPYFQKTPPKSTGRDLFHAAWLDGHLAALGRTKLPPEDVQATLCELTVQSVCEALRRAAPACQELLVCGGGALNGRLMQRLSGVLASGAAPVQVGSTADRGLAPMLVEAAAFAWLAVAHVHRLPGNRPEVTGAAGLRVLGALHPAR